MKFTKYYHLSDKLYNQLELLVDNNVYDSYIDIPNYVVKEICSIELNMSNEDNIDLVIYITYGRILKDEYLN